MDTLAGAHSDRARTHNQSLPVEVFMKGENISGFNPAGDTRSYYCFRIPQLLALPSGRLLAFAEGRADGCRPDVHVNRPIVVRASSDQGATWGPIGIAGPALPHQGTNYPGAYLRDNTTIALRYSISNGTVFETSSSDEGTSWSAPVTASQPEGNITCGSAWPKMLGSDVVMPCSNGHTGRSSDGGRTWRVSTKPVALNTNVTGVTGLGESMAVPDGRTPESLTMMIRAGVYALMSARVRVRVCAGCMRARFAVF
jgi:Neuraminidase (sialidase)